MSLSSTLSQLPSYTPALSYTAWSSYSIPPSYTASPSYTFTQLSSITLSPSPSASLHMQSNSLSMSPSYTALPSYSLPQSSFTTSPSLSISPSACRNSNPPQLTGNFLSNVSDAILVTIICIIIMLQVYSCVSAMHYYTALNDEKIKRRLVNDHVQANPYHSSVRETFNRI
jgi:hypothetical protein